MLTAPGFADEIPNILDHIRRGARVEHYITKRQTKDGRIITVSLTVSPIRDASGRIVGASKVARDITERESNQQALRDTNSALSRANSDLEQFAFSVSHDLQEPIRNISIYAQLLERNCANVLDQESKHHIAFIVNGTRRLEALIRDLLAYTQTMDLPSVNEPLDANLVWTETVETYISTVREVNALISADTLPLIRIQPAHLQQLFGNLLSNALKYRSTEPLRIHLTARRLGLQWMLSMQDNGIGIDPRYATKIFGLFKRLHNPEAYPGTGIGLATCERFVHRYGGQIWVESELGKGATFHFTVPGA
jgi:light-regulated signal transduction histidine kinase (bacteriophytochrome)